MSSLSSLRCDNRYAHIRTGLTTSTIDPGPIPRLRPRRMRSTRTCSETRRQKSKHFTLTITYGVVRSSVSSLSHPLFSRYTIDRRTPRMSVKKEPDYRALETICHVVPVDSWDDPRYSQTSHSSNSPDEKVTDKNSL